MHEIYQKLEINNVTIVTFGWVNMRICLPKEKDFDRGNNHTKAIIA